MQNLEEEVATVNPITGQIIGTVDRAKAHKEGVWHASIHVWILDDQNRLLFQKRSQNSKHFASQWDISAAGHINSAVDNGFREITEELGVIPNKDDLQFIGNLVTVHDLPNFNNKERPRVYLWESKLKLKDFKFQDGEVEALAAVSLKDVDDFINQKTVYAEILENATLTKTQIDGQLLVPQSAAYWDALRSYVLWPS